ncbi:MAG: aldehyde-activating protein [Pseudomonadota bacterium]
MFTLECHCGRLKLSAQVAPVTITSCNCSICHRLGALWAYYDRADVEIDCDNNAVNKYSWREKTMIYYRCKHCGCTTHYATTEDDGNELIALNCRMANQDAIDGILIRPFDGKDTWRYLDE